MIKVIHGDSRTEIATLIQEGIVVDAIVTDPPYELNISTRGWDQTGIAFDVAFWQQCLSILKPGGHLLAFAAAKNYHHAATAIEQAGFDIRDQLMWIYSSGIPKSMDASKALDKAAGVERTEIIGIKSGHEGFANRKSQGHSKFRDGFARAWQHDNTARNRYYYETAPVTPQAIEWSGWGTALRPAHEPIVLARKPFKGTLAANLIEHGAGALNIASNRLPDNQRWPANVIHDGSDLVSDLFENGTRANYFYVAKPAGKERTETNDHPTAKPLELMQHLVRLVTPKSGLILDPFAGTGTTGEAAILEGFKAILIERDGDYCKTIQQRVDKYPLLRHL